MISFRLFVILAVLIVCGATIAARSDDAEQNENEQIDSTPGKGPLSLDYFSMDFQLEAEAERRTVRTDAGGFGTPRFAQRNRRYRLEESLGMEAGGSIVNDRVLKYGTKFRFGMVQERFEERSPLGDLNTGPDGTLLEYDLNFTLFPAGKLSATAYASKLEDRLPRPFLPSLDRRRERIGAGLFFNDPKLPMSLTFEHIFDDVTSNSRYLLDDEERGEDTLRYEATWQPTQYHSLNLQYEYERRTEQYSGTQNTFNTERNYLTLSDVLQFGEKKRHRLDTLFRIEEESGDIPRDTIEFSPRLRIQHTDNLFTTYRFQFLEQTFRDVETDTLRGDWNLTHQFEETLTSTVGIYGLRQDTNLNADATEWGALANFSFNRDNRLGRFGANLSYIHSDTQTNDGRRGGIVTEESVTFRDPLPAYLSQRNIDVLSVVVWDPTRTRLYLLGRDYLLVPVRDAMTIVRVRTGQIADRQTVLVSYTYRSFRDYHVSRDRVDLRLQQRFKNGFDVYYAASLQDEDIDRSSFLVFDERNINRHRLGVTYQKTRWSAGLELEYNDDSIDPYMAVHTNGDVSILQNAEHQLSGRANYSFFRFEGQDFFQPRQTSLLDMGLNYRYLMGRNLEANASAMYRYETDTLFGETQGVDLTASVAYKIGLFSVLVEFEHDMLDLPSSTDNTTAVWLKVRRDIPVLGARTR